MVIFDIDGHLMNDNESNHEFDYGFLKVLHVCSITYGDVIPE